MSICIWYSESQHKPHWCCESSQAIYIIVNGHIDKIIKKHPPLCEAQRVQKSVNPETKKVAWLQNRSRGPIIFQNRISNFKCFLTTFSTVKTLKKQLQKKRLKFWIWISNFCSTSSLGHGLSGTVLTLLWNPVVATQSGWACSSIPTMAASHRLKCSCTRFRETSLTATTYGPLV